MMRKIVLIELSGSTRQADFKPEVLIQSTKNMFSFRHPSEVGIKFSLRFPKDAVDEETTEHTLRHWSILVTVDWIASTDQLVIDQVSNWLRDYVAGSFFDSWAVVNRHRDRKDNDMITLDEARQLAYDWHGGGSFLYQFASTGETTNLDQLVLEIDEALESMLGFEDQYADEANEELGQPLEFATSNLKGQS